MKVRRKTPTMEAVKWKKVGDHADVKAYSQTEVHPDSECRLCRRAYRAHGWIEHVTVSWGSLVCPGDYVINHTNGAIEVCRASAFHQLFEEVSNAVGRGVEQRGNFPEYQDGDCGGKTAEAGGCHRTEHGATQWRGHSRSPQQAPHRGSSGAKEKGLDDWDED